MTPDPSTEARAAAAFERVSGTVPSQWYIDLKRNHDALAARLSQAKEVVKAWNHYKRVAEMPAADAATADANQLLVVALDALAASLTGERTE